MSTLVTNQEQEITPAEEAKRKAEFDFYWHWCLHEDNIFTNRGAFFLVGESMIMAAAATILAADKLSLHYHYRILCGTGVFVTLIWLYVSAIHIYATQKRIKERLTDERWNVIARARQKFGGNHFFMGIVLPVGVLIAWFFLFRK